MCTNCILEGRQCWLFSMDVNLARISRAIVLSWLWYLVEYKTACFIILRRYQALSFGHWKQKTNCNDLFILCFFAPWSTLISNYSKGDFKNNCILLQCDELQRRPILLYQTKISVTCRALKRYLSMGKFFVLILCSSRKRKKGGKLFQMNESKIVITTLGEIWVQNYFLAE